MTKEQETRNKVEIVQKDAPVLREVAKNVPVKDIKGKKIQDILKTMKKALAKEEDGVAIAAPQIGESLRIFIVSGKVLKREGDPEDYQPEDLVFINPEIVKLSRKKTEVEEGCLSVRWLYGWVKRSEKATVLAYDAEGGKFQAGGSGLMAQIFQHETDHLDGILFIDKAKDLEELPPQESKASRGASSQKHKGNERN